MVRLLALLLFVAYAYVQSAHCASTPVKAANATIPVGISAGAFFAVQYHVAFSANTLGSGIIAGGPFYCAQDSETTALTACTADPLLLDVKACISAAKACEAGGVCDSTANLRTQRSWLFSGTFDTVVNTGVMKALDTFYGTFMGASNISTSFNKVPAAHGWITQNYGNKCGHFGSPYIQNCNVDASFEMLSFVLGRNLSAPGKALMGNYHTLEQAAYTPERASPASLSLGPQAYVYVPAACSSQPGSCLLVIAFHGCEMTVSDIGTDFVSHSGLNELAETNGFMVLYPQAIRHDFAPLNPEGCFDWWGYTTNNYANQKGPQMTTVNNMAKALISGINVTAL